jgi:hypothetical protein
LALTVSTPRALAELRGAYFEASVPAENPAQGGVGESNAAAGGHGPDPLNLAVGGWLFAGQLQSIERRWDQGGIDHKGQGSKVFQAVVGVVWVGPDRVWKPVRCIAGVQV